MATAIPRLDGFEFLAPLGQGAFGQVWKARDVRLDTLRAVKIIARERFTEAGVRRLVAEARTLARLPPHRNRVGVHQLRDAVTNCFLVMDYVAGGSLAAHTGPGRPLPWAAAARYAGGVGDTLAEVHAHGLVHRDIKPDNILLDPDRDEAVLGDFGITAGAGDPGGPVGTRGYVAPEALLAAGPSPKSDVFALAATLLHLVTGEVPRHGGDVDRHPGFGDLPPEVRAVIRAGMEPDPADRADLPGFLGRLREARWRVLADQIFKADAAAASPVRVRASLSAAPAADPRAFAPMAAAAGEPVALATGDLLKVEATATADGFHTVLVLGSSGELGIALPRPTAPANRFAAGQRHTTLLKLTPPGGTERVVVLWTRHDVTKTAAGWAKWLERFGAKLPGPAPAARPLVRGMEVVGTAAAPAPDAEWRAVVVPVVHREAGA